MSKLIHAEMVRLFKTGIWYRIVIGVLCLAAFMIGFIFWDHTQRPNGYIRLDPFFQGYFWCMGTLIAVLTAMFTGTEFSERTVNNKLICGYTRPQVYISGLTVCAASAVILQVLFALLIFLLQTVLFGDFRQSWDVILAMEVKGALVSVSYASLLYMLCMMIGKRSEAVVVTVFLSLVLIVASALLHSFLHPQYAVRFLSNGETIIYTILENALPTGQAVLLSDSEHTPALWQFLLSDCVMTVLTSVVGIGVFRKKDLK